MFEKIKDNASYPKWDKHDPFVVLLYSTKLNNKSCPQNYLIEQIGDVRLMVNAGQSSPRSPAANARRITDIVHGVHGTR